jgi:CSLREA domain-containing protein
MKPHPQVGKLPRSLFRGWVVALAVGILLGPGPTSAAHSETYTVTKTDDTNDGACDSDCSLREAIITANASPGSDSITLPSGTFVLTISGTHEDSAATGDLDITDSLTLLGAGTTHTIIDGGAIDRVVHVIGSTT